MALYSAKEAKWYRRNVERREHCQFFFLLLLPTPPPPHPVCFVEFPVVVWIRFPLDYNYVRRGPRPIAKFGFFLFFFYLPPLSRDLPRSTSFSLPKVRFNYITCCSCQATRGYETYASQGCACGNITSTKWITRHDRAFGKGSRTRNWFPSGWGMKPTQCPPDAMSRLFAHRDEECTSELNFFSFARKRKQPIVRVWSSPDSMRDRGDLYGRKEYIAEDEDLFPNGLTRFQEVIILGRFSMHLWKRRLSLRNVTTNNSTWFDSSSLKVRITKRTRVRLINQSSIRVLENVTRYISSGWEPSLLRYTRETRVWLDGEIFGEVWTIQKIRSILSKFCQVNQKSLLVILTAFW